MEINKDGLTIIVGRRRKPPCESLTKDNVEKAKEGLEQGKSIKQVSRETGITIHYMTKIRKGEKLPIKDEK